MLIDLIKDDIQCNIDSSLLFLYIGPSSAILSENIIVLRNLVLKDEFFQRPLSFFRSEIWLLISKDMSSMLQFYYSALPEKFMVTHDFDKDFELALKLKKFNCVDVLLSYVQVPNIFEKINIEIDSNHVRWFCENHISLPLKIAKKVKYSIEFDKPMIMWLNNMCEISDSNADSNFIHHVIERNYMNVNECSELIGKLNIIEYMNHDELDVLRCVQGLIECKVTSDDAISESFSYLLKCCSDEVRNKVLKHLNELELKFNEIYEAENSSDKFECSIESESESKSKSEENTCLNSNDQSFDSIRVRDETKDEIERINKNQVSLIERIRLQKSIITSEPTNQTNQIIKNRIIGFNTKSYRTIHF